MEYEFSDLDLVRRLLHFIGENPDREGLKDTPRRFLKSWREMCLGYYESPEEILQRDFGIPEYDQIIACPWIEFYSTCEHHLLPFSGYAHVGYLPAQGKECRVVGLSKMARLVDCFARRLQIQERLTNEIATSMDSILKPRGVAVVMQAKHECMMCRGVKKHSPVMVTSAMLGVFKSDASAKEEFFQIVQLAQHSNG